ncbi:MAG: protein kinase [Myxococcota bacterium]
MSTDPPSTSAAPSRATIVVDELPAESSSDATSETGLGLELVGKAGEGSMGEVLIATDRDLDRTVAFKVMHPELAARPGLAERFFAEARIAARLDHPGIVPIHGLVRSDDGRLGYTMKLVRGRTLAQWIADVARVAPGVKLGEDVRLEVRLEVFLKLCDAVGYAHDQGVVHRDLKPENVMLGDHGEVYVMDWGLAASPDEAAPSGGTPGFVPPEGGAAPEADLYALGVVLRELATLTDGRVPAGSEPRYDRRGEVVPRELGAIVARATAPLARARYPSVRALADDVRRFLRGSAVEALPDDGWRALLRWIGRHRQLVAGMLVLSFTAGFAGVGWTQRARWRERTEAAVAQQALAQRVGDTATRAAELDARLARYQGLAQTFGAVALERWRDGKAHRGPVYLAEDFRDPARAPPDLAPSEAYGTPISAGSPVVMVALHDPPHLAAAARVATLGAVARGLFELGHSAPPPAYLSVAFEDGVWLSYPGHGAFPPGYDARERPWYTTAAAATGPVWSAPYVDSSGLGLLLPCSVPLRDAGALVGVAAVKLPLSAVTADLVQVEGGEGFVLDREGRIVLRGTQATDAPPALDNEQVVLPLFDLPEVVEAVRAGQPGVTRAGSELVVWQPLVDLGWAYVVRGDEGVLRAAARSR